jgi:hypothetical protein
MNPCHPVIARRLLGMGALLLAVAGVAAPAQARVFIGIGVPFGVYVPPPAYYPPPPVYYAPPPPYYAPLPVYAPPPNYSQAPGYSEQAQPSGQMCYAPTTSCPMDHPTSPGAACYCLGEGGQHLWGRAN